MNGIEKLAFITVTDQAGRDVVLAAEDVLRASEVAEGVTLIVFRSGGTMSSKTAASSIKTSIDTLWDEYTAALGDPA